MIDALISGGASLIGNLANNIWGGANASSANQQNQQNAWLGAQWNLAAQQQNQAWMEKMSSTAYQRGVKDMRAAGLNPALMFGSGGPASSPSSAAAVGPNFRDTNVSPASDVITPAVSSALQAYNIVQSVEKMAAETQNVKETNQLIQAQEHATNAQAAATYASIPGIDKEPRVKEAAAQASEAAAKAASARARLDQLQADSVSKYGFGADSVYSSGRKAMGNAGSLLKHLWDKVNPILTPFSELSPSAKERNPEYRNGRIGRPPMPGDFSF